MNDKFKNQQFPGSLWESECNIPPAVPGLAEWSSQYFRWRVYFYGICAQSRSLFCSLRARSRVLYTPSEMCYIVRSGWKAKKNAFKDSLEGKFINKHVFKWAIETRAPRIMRLTRSPRDTLHDFCSPLRSWQITLCDMDLLNLGTTCM